MITRRRTPKPPKAPKVRRNLEDMRHNELESLLDDEYSILVRGRAAIKNGSNWLRCFTCGAPMHWKSADNGHFLPRALRGTRFDLRNQRPQCKRCNWTLEGNKLEYEKRLRAEIGDEEVDALITTAGFWGAARHTRDWLIEQIGDLRQQTAPIKKALKALDGGTL